jgi:hypothetical protein
MICVIQGEVDMPCPAGYVQISPETGGQGFRLLWLAGFQSSFFPSRITAIQVVNFFKAQRLENRQRLRAATTGLAVNQVLFIAGQLFQVV